MRKVLPLCWLAVFQMTLFAYDVRKTMLTEGTYDPVGDAVAIHVLAIDVNTYQDKLGDVTIATITLKFEPDEIGQDYKAEFLLAKKEARQLGADLVLLISATKYKATGAIASGTFRCVRTKKQAERSHRKLGFQP